MRRVLSKLVELRGLEPLTPCMPNQQSRYQLRHAVRGKKKPAAEPATGALVLDVWS